MTEGRTIALSSALPHRPSLDGLGFGGAACQSAGTLEQAPSEPDQLQVLGMWT